MNHLDTVKMQVLVQHLGAAGGLGFCISIKLQGGGVQKEIFFF